MIIFNPPYLPTKPEEKIGKNGWFDYAVDGGATGLTQIDRFLTQISKYLSPTGRGYFLMSSHSPTLSLQKYQKYHHIHLEKIATKYFEDEHLFLFQICPIMIKK
jgi:methylase of polypeptide subunit release factors